MSKKEEGETVEKENEDNEDSQDSDNDDNEEENEINLIYNDITKKMSKTPNNYEELLNHFLKAFGEDKNQKFEFFYRDKKNNNKLEKLKENFGNSNICDIKEFKIIKKGENISPSISSIRKKKKENNDNKEKTEEPISSPSCSIMLNKKDENIDDEEQKNLIQKLEKELEVTRIKYKQCLDKNKELKTKKNNL